MIGLVHADVDFGRSTGGTLEGIGIAALPCPPQTRRGTHRNDWVPRREAFYAAQRRRRGARTAIVAFLELEEIEPSEQEG